MRGGMPPRSWSLVLFKPRTRSYLILQGFSIISHHPAVAKSLCFLVSFFPSSFFLFELFFISFPFCIQDEYFWEVFGLGGARLGGRRRGGIRFHLVEFLIEPGRDGFGSTLWAIPNPPRVSTKYSKVQWSGLLTSSKPDEPLWGMLSGWDDASPPPIFHSSFPLSGYATEFDSLELMEAYM